MISESVILPSLGYPYHGKLDGTSIKVSPLTTRAYKDFLVSVGDEGLENLINSCLVDSPLKADDLVYQDTLAVYFKIRAISLGSKVPVYSVCPGCQNRNTEDMDINALKCSYFSISEYPYSVVLPITKKRIKVSLPTGKTQKRASDEAKRRANIFSKPQSDFLPSLQAASILAVDGLLDLAEVSDWYNDLPLKDALYIDRVMEKMQNFGIHTLREVECAKCKKAYTVPLRITNDFFRTDIGDLEGIKVSEGTLEKGPSGSGEAKQDS